MSERQRAAGSNTAVDVTYALNEMFLSVQGEAYWSGQPMWFIRFAGCNLRCVWCDQPDTIAKGYVDRWGGSWEMRYVKTKLARILSALDDRPDVKHVCLTGGEPGTHKLDALIMALGDRGKYIHMETNGTTYQEWMRHVHWITVSPKREQHADPRVLVTAAEMKFIVDKDFQLVEALEYKTDWPQIPYWWLSPCNYTEKLDPDMADKAYKMALEYPDFRVTQQMHKVLGVK